MEAKEDQVVARGQANQEMTEPGFGSGGLLLPFFEPQDTLSPGHVMAITGDQRT